MTDLLEPAVGELSPLAVIERAVQARAKEIQLDLASVSGPAHLRRLISDEIAAWTEAFRRGHRSFDISDNERLAERAFRNLAGYGPLEPLLDDPDVWEIAINAPDLIFAKRHHGQSGYHDEVFHDRDHVVRVLTKILDDASGSHRKLDPAEGLQDAQLESGARLHIVHSDVGRDANVLVNIRKFTGLPHARLDELVARDMIEPVVAEFLRACVRAGTSIVFAGPPGSGKTTLLSCCAAELDPSLRVVIAEEVFEVDVPLPNVASMQTRPPRADRKEIDLRRLVSGFLRMAPDVAIVGEVRDREALPLLLTMSSGVKGFTTIHAGSARQALTRLRFVCQLADTQIPMAALNSLVTEAVDVVVHASRHEGRPRINEILAVEDLLAGAESTTFTVSSLFERPRHDQPLQWSGTVPTRLARPLERAGYDVLALLDPMSRRDLESPSALIGVLVACVGAYGVFLAYTAIAFGWSGVGVGPPVRQSPRSRRGVQDWLMQAGLEGASPVEFAAVVVGLGLLGGLLALALFGAPLPALVATIFGATLPVGMYRARRERIRAEAQEAWPRMIEEIRLQTGALGRSIPQAMVEVGRRCPLELRPAFEAATREWVLTTDFERMVIVLKDRLADATADAACETLLVAHQLGGGDLDRRLVALLEDRRQDLQGRKDARAKQAGVLFARRFVLVVPLGMALAGLSIGTGRAAYQTPLGQAAVAVGIACVVGCWVWASRLLKLPHEQRVFTA